MLILSMNACFCFPINVQISHTQTCVLAQSSALFEMNDEKTQSQADVQLTAVDYYLN